MGIVLKNRSRFCGTIAALAVLAFQSKPAHSGDDGTGPLEVLVLVAKDSDETTNEALHRVIGELMGAGFTITQRRLQNATTPQLELQSRRLGPNAIAAFAIIEDDETPAVWVADRRTGRVVIQRASLADIEPGRRAAALAFAVVDILRAGLGEDWPQETKPPSPPPATTAPAPRALSESLERETKPTRPPDELVDASLHGVQTETNPFGFAVGASARRFATADVWLWGATLSALPVAWRWLRAGVEANVELGNKDQELVSTSIIVGSVAPSVMLHAQGGWWATAVGVGARAGIARLSGHVDNPQRFTAQAGTGVWAGPAVCARLATFSSHRSIAAFLGAEAGWAFTPTVGTIPDGSEVRLDASWLAITLSVGRKP